MDLVKLISRIGNVIIIAVSIFLGGLIFYFYSGSASIGERLAYSVIFAAAIFTLFYTFKITIIWFIKALKK